MHRRLLGLTKGLLVVGLLAAVGCGSSDLVPAKGKVTLNGQPLSKGNISFRVATGQGATATVPLAQDGTFDLMTGASKGIKPGDYIVTVVGYGAAPKADPKMPDPPPVVITPSKYNDWSKSGLKAKVSASGIEPPEFALTGQPDPVEAPKGGPGGKKR